MALTLQIATWVLVAGSICGAAYARRQARNLAKYARRWREAVGLIEAQQLYIGALEDHVADAQARRLAPPESWLPPEAAEQRREITRLRVAMDSDLERRVAQRNGSRAS